jgi:hypothetical protein
VSKDEPQPVLVIRQSGKNEAAMMRAAAELIAQGRRNAALG